MYRVLHKSSGRDITILDDRWHKQIQQLRAFDQQGELVCPGCQQPVRVRAGEIKRWHFAHKHLQNCPFQWESPELLKTRAVLYHWLAAKFGAKTVTIEKIMTARTFQRPIDCWVEHEGQTFAYWIFDQRLPPEARNNLKVEFKHIGTPVNWVFTFNFLREDDPVINNRLHLTTTERAFMSDSDLNVAWQTDLEQPGGSLHYLNADRETLTTFRNLKLVHSPQLYAGTRLQTPLIEISASAQNGEFIHPGETERYEKRSEEIEQQRKEAQVQLTSVQDFLKLAAGMKPGPRFQRKPEPILRSFERKATCKFCGTVTTEWVIYFGETKECICRKCKHKAGSV